MKCYNCHEELQEFVNSYNTSLHSFECPNMHLTIDYEKDINIRYTMYWDMNKMAKRRYKLLSSNLSNSTTLQQLRSGFVYYSYQEWETILDVPYYTPVEIEDNEILKNNVLKFVNLLVFL